MPPIFEGAMPVVLERARDLGREFRSWYKDVHGEEPCDNERWDNLSTVDQAHVLDDWTRNLEADVLDDDEGDPDDELTEEQWLRVRAAWINAVICD